MIYEGTLFYLTALDFEYKFKYPFKDDLCTYLIDAIKTGYSIDILPRYYTKTIISGLCNQIPTSLSFRVMGKYI